MENINEEKLEQLGIFEIRNIAREVGVYSPTLLKKQELIDKIMRVISGQDAPYIKTTKQGRPPKNITNLNKFVDVFVPSYIFEKDEIKESLACFNDINESINVKDYGNNEKLFDGLVKVYNDFSLVFLEKFKEDKKSVVFINSTQTKFYNLRTGDNISGKALFINEDNPLILKEIYSLNEKNFQKEYIREGEFYDKIAIHPNKKIIMDIYNNDDEIYSQIDTFSPIAKGQRILLKNIQDGFAYQVLHRFTTSNNQLKGLAILIDETPENYFEISSNDHLDCISNNYDSKDNILLEIEVKISNLKRRVEDGEDVVLFINSIENLTNYIINEKILKKLSKDEAQIKVEQTLTNIILLGKNTSKGSLTIIACEKANRCFKDSLFNNILYFEKDKYNVKLNINLSSIIGIEKILTKSELEKLKNL